MTETEFPKLWIQEPILLAVCLFSDELYSIREFIFVGPVEIRTYRNTI